MGGGEGGGGGDGWVQRQRLSVLLRFPLCLRVRPPPTPQAMKKGATRASVGGRDGSALLQPNEIKLSDQPGPSMPINEAELSAAFDFFDISGQGRITPNDLKQRLGAFYKNLPVRAAALTCVQKAPRPLFFPQCASRVAP